ncbi:hypothetical protein Tco_0483353 [Tanacetum coccineum]
MVPNLWSPVKVVYDKHAYWGTSHWVTSLKIMKWYDYGHLDEIEVRREDQQLSTFKDGIRMEYLPKRKWSRLDKRRAHVMIQDIDKQLFQRRLMRNLEKFVGGRENEEDLRLLERTI